MSNDPPTTSPPEPTDVRFSVRALLIGVAGGAVSLAAFGAYYRCLESPQNFYLLTAWVAWTLFVALWLGMYVLLRYRAECQTGRVLMWFPSHRYFLSDAGRRAIGLGRVALLTLGMLLLLNYSYLLSAPTPPSGSFGKAGSTGLLAGLLTGYGLRFFWRGHGVRIGERAVSDGLAIVPWRQVRRYYWDATDRQVLVLEAPGGRMAGYVPPGQRAAVEALLEEKLGGMSDV